MKYTPYYIDIDRHRRKTIEPCYNIFLASIYKYGGIFQFRFRVYFTNGDFSNTVSAHRGFDKRDKFP